MHGIDRTKAAAIAVVCLIHVLDPWGGRAGLVGRLSPILTEWAVPAFFFAGGYVRYRETPYPAGTIRRWLGKLLPLYLAASLMAFLARWLLLDERLAPAQMCLNLLTGSAWPVYYFVPLFLGALVFSTLLARFPGAVPPVAALSVALLVDTRLDAWKDPLWATYGLFGIVRSPFFWWGYFVAGWAARRWTAGPSASRWLFPASASVAALGCVTQLLVPPGPLVATARVAVGVATPMAILFVSQRPAGMLAGLLARHSYGIYLFHYFVIIGAKQWGYSSKSMASVAVVWLASVAGGLLVAASASRVLDLSSRRPSRVVPAP